MVGRSFALGWCVQGFWWGLASGVSRSRRATRASHHNPMNAAMPTAAMIQTESHTLSMGPPVLGYERYGDQATGDRTESQQEYGTIGPVSPEDRVEGCECEEECADLAAEVLTSLLKSRCSRGGHHAPKVR